MFLPRFILMNRAPFLSLKEFLTLFGKKSYLWICSPFTEVSDLVAMNSFGFKGTDLIIFFWIWWSLFGFKGTDLITSFWIQRGRFDDLFFVQERQIWWPLLAKISTKIQLTNVFRFCGFINAFWQRFQLTDLVTPLRNIPINLRVMLSDLPMT